ncbi:MAG TPA: hypothetical protein VKX40_00105 [Aequorivita sp.]|nr:hypothetical protein [Aequorivita sp.]
MTKSIIFIAILLFLWQPIYSQEHQISAGMGIGSTNQILDGFLSFGSAFSAVFFDSSYHDKTKNLGEFRLAYAYTPKERWGFGGAFSYNYSEFDIIRKEEKLGEQTNSYYTLAAETSYSFLKKEKLNLYVLLGAGATLGTAKQTKLKQNTEITGDDIFFNFQITPIGISYGKHWGGFAELGFGYRGLFSFGVFYDLK